MQLLGISRRISLVVGIYQVHIVQYTYVCIRNWWYRANRSLHQIIYAVLDQAVSCFIRYIIVIGCTNALFIRRYPVVLDAYGIIGCIYALFIRILLILKPCKLYKNILYINLDIYVLILYNQDNHTRCVQAIKCYQKLSHVIKCYQKLSNKNVIIFAKAIKCYQIKM